MKFNISCRKEKYQVLASKPLSSDDFEPETAVYLTGLDISFSQAVKINELVKNIKSGLSISTLDEVFDYLYIFAVEKQTLAVRNLVKNAHYCTIMGVLPFTEYQGFKATGNDTYLDTNYNPQLHSVRFTQNDAGEGAYIRTRPDDDYKLVSGTSVNIPSNNITQIYPKVAGYFQVAINSLAGSNRYNVLWDKGMYAQFRDNSTTIRSFINSMIHQTVTTNTSAPLLSQNEFICCRNFNGFPGTYADYEISIKFKSRSLTKEEYLAFLNALEKYMISIGKSVLPFMETQVDKSSITYSSVFVRDVDYPGRRFRIPFTLITDNNVLIVGCEARETTSDFAIMDIVYKRSTDFGKTWSGGNVAIPNNGIYLTDQNHGSRTPAVCTLKHNGRLYLFCGKVDDETYNTYFGIIPDPLLYQSYFGYVYSDDEGLTWSAYQDLSALKSPETNLLIGCPSANGIIMQDGTLVLPALDHRHSPNTAESGSDWGIRSLLIYSTDNGVTWQKSNSIPQFTDECQIVEYEPGKIFIKCRNWDSKYRVFTTSNLGQTWTAHPYDKKLIDVSCQTSFLKYTYKGKTKYLMGMPTFYPTRIDVRLRVSDDLINWGNLHQVWEPLSDGYTNVDANKYGNLFMTLETTVDILTWDFSAFKQYIIR